MLLKRMAFFVSLMIFVLPPLIPFHLPPMGSFWSEWTAGALALLSFCFIWSYPSRTLVLPAGIIPWAGWGIALSLAIGFSEYKIVSPAYFSGIFWVIGAFTLFLASSLKQEFGLNRVTIAVGYALLISGFLQSVFGIARFYGLLSSFSPWLQPVSVGRMPGLLNYPTITGFSLWLSVYAIVYLFCKRKVGYLVSVLSLIPISTSIVAVGDRASFLYGTVLLLVPLFIYFRTVLGDGDWGGDHKRNLKAIVVVALVLVCSVPIFGFLNTTLSKPSLNHNIEKKSIGFVRNYERQGDFFGIRGTEFEKAIFLAKSHFWVGVGPGNYPYQSYILNGKIKGAVREGTVNTNSHNIFSMVLAEEGIVGVFALILGVFFLIYWWWRFLPFEESLFFGSVLGAFFIFSNIEFPLWYLNFLVIFMFIVGLVSPNFILKLDHSWVKPCASALVIVIGGAVAVNIAYGFFEISFAQRDRNIDAKDYTTLASWTADRMLEPYAMLALEQYTVPRAINIKRQLSNANRLISRFPMPKALLDKSILLLFERNEKEACNIAMEAASSYPYIMKEYNAEMSHYTQDDKKLPADPRVLRHCIEEGLVQWNSQTKR